MEELVLHVLLVAFRERRGIAIAAVWHVMQLVCLYFNVIFLPAWANWRSVNLTTLSWAHWRLTSTQAHPSASDWQLSHLNQRWNTIILMNDYDGACPAVKWHHWDSNPRGDNPLDWHRVVLTPGPPTRRAFHPFAVLTICTLRRYHDIDWLLWSMNTARIIIGKFLEKNCNWRTVKDRTICTRWLQGCS